MALLSLPLLSFRASGSVARSLTYRRWKSLNYASSITTHSDTGSQPQLDFRAVTRDFSVQMRDYLSLPGCAPALTLSSHVFGRGYSWFIHLLPKFRVNYFPSIFAFPYSSPWIYEDPDYVYVFFPRRASPWVGGSCDFALDKPVNFFSLPMIQHWSGDAFIYWPKTHGPDRLLFVCVNFSDPSYFQFGGLYSFLIPGY